MKLMQMRRGKERFQISIVSIFSKRESAERRCVMAKMSMAAFSRAGNERRAGINGTSQGHPGARRENHCPGHMLSHLTFSSQSY